MPAGTEALHEIVTGLLRLGVLAAREDVDAGVAAFGPGMDGKVGFRQQPYRRYALWMELMAGEVQKSGQALFGCLFDRVANKEHVVKEVRRTAVEFQNAVRANRGNSQCFTSNRA